MTKSELVNRVSSELGYERKEVLDIVESFMITVKSSLTNGENIYLRGFGSFIVKTRAEKTGRNIKKNEIVKIPKHNIPAFKPAKEFLNAVKEHNKP